MSLLESEKAKAIVKRELTRKVIKFEYCWEIEDFDEDEDYFDCNIPTPELNGLNWTFICEPNYEHDVYEFSAMGVGSSLMYDMLFCKKEMYLYNANHEKVSVGKLGLYDDDENEKIASLSLQELRPFVVDHKLFILFEIQIYRLYRLGKEMIFRDVSVFKDMNTAFEEALKNKRKIDGSEKMHLKYEKMFDERKHCDVILEVDGEEIQAHKAILSINSPVFDAEFEHDMEEKKKNRVKIVGIDVETVKQMLRFMYCGRIDETRDVNVKELMKAADRYLMEELKLMCSKQLLRNVTVDNSMELLVLSDETNSFGMKRKLCDYINENKDQVCETQKWQEIAEKRPRLVVDLYKCCPVLNKV